MDAPELLPRRWLSHERHVLLVIALVAAIGLGWLSWQAAIVQHRRAMREQIEVSEDGYFRFHPSANFERTRPAETGSGLSRVRLLLGDEEFPLILFSRPITAANREAIEAFPEAEVYELVIHPTQLNSRTRWVHSTLVHQPPEAVR